LPQRFGQGEPKKAISSLEAEKRSSLSSSWQHDLSATTAPPSAVAASSKENGTKFHEVVDSKDCASWLSRVSEYMSEVLKAVLTPPFLKLFNSYVDSVQYSSNKIYSYKNNIYLDCYLES
jgi:hypothetical protein